MTKIGDLNDLHSTLATMKSAKEKGVNMNIWDRDIKAVEGAIAAIEALRAASRPAPTREEIARIAQNKMAELYCDNREGEIMNAGPVSYSIADAILALAGDLERARGASSSGGSSHDSAPTSAKNEGDKRVLPGSLDR